MNWRAAGLVVMMIVGGCSESYGESTAATEAGREQVKQEAENQAKNQEKNQAKNQAKNQTGDQPGDQSTANHVEVPRKENTSASQKDAGQLQETWLPLKPAVRPGRIQTERSGTVTPQLFPEKYTHVPGVLTFRGNALRDTPAYGTRVIRQRKLETVWSFTTSSSSWGGGAGWTGQPVLVQWSEETKLAMNLKAVYKSQKNFVEAIYASLDGNVYFLDLETGRQTRSPIRTGNPIKGSPSLDSRGFPLLYVGEGIPEKGTIGFGLYSLLDGKRLYYQKGIDPFAPRKWGAFDSSALFNRSADTLTVGGENGLLYTLKLNTRYDPGNKVLSISPQPVKYKYAIDGKKGNPYQGIENSVAAYKNLAFFSDNMGSLQAVNLQTMTPVWSNNHTDDTDSTIAVEVEQEHPYLYTGTEVDKQGSKGDAQLRKVDGITGETLWRLHVPALTVKGEHPVNGGLLATPAFGKGKTGHLIFFTVARYKTLNGGLLLAIDKRTGKEVWRWNMPSYAWSSPVAVTDKSGTAYLIQSDSAGSMYLLDALQGKVLHKINLGANIEASPAVFDDMLVVATRGGKMYGVRMK
ncbi:outer membrane protein assembly factor BamB family protein [Paenibacillus gansuensis]|uniref:PQQ-binding-like beta-propeller repeat protein n=1 Tax=Paenibacillus gansuensis TaxID=306542 RepID=A0ABW5P6S9_9BACL